MHVIMGHLKGFGGTNIWFSAQCGRLFTKCVCVDVFGDGSTVYVFIYLFNNYVIKYFIIYSCQHYAIRPFFLHQGLQRSLTLSMIFSKLILKTAFTWICYLSKPVSLHCEPLTSSTPSQCAAYLYFSTTSLLRRICKNLPVVVDFQDKYENIIRKVLSRSMQVLFKIEYVTSSRNFNYNLVESGCLWLHHIQFNPSFSIKFFTERKMKLT